MIIIQINSHNFSSTGNIMLGIAEVARKRGMNCITSCPDGKSMRIRKLDNHIYIGGRLGRNLHLLLAKIAGLNGCFSIIDTWCFLHKIKKIQPATIHLHNLHNCYINLPLLFHYIKRHNIPVVWTLHDCWSFTGHCPYFTMAKCDKWKTRCGHCPSYREYPASLFDNSKMMYRLKKRWFTGIENMTVVTPSQWLADLVKQSFLKDYPVRVINNGIDLKVFKSRESEFRAKHGIADDKYIVLGVAFEWSKRKGLDVFVELSKRLDCKKYQIVLVGTDNSVDKQLPENILSIHRTNDQQELAEIYTTADIFVNPTREEVLGMVNIEAMACGTPVLTFRSGGSPECLSYKSGTVVECDDIDTLESEIRQICLENPYTSDDCRNAALRFSKEDRFNQYCDLYKELYDDYKKRDDFK